MRVNSSQRRVRRIRQLRLTILTYTNNGALGAKARLALTPKTRCADGKCKEKDPEASDT